MTTTPEQRTDQAAYRRLSSFINQSYPPGRFVAISEGQIVADAAGFEELKVALQDMGKNPGQALVVQSGVEYPESVVIFCRKH
jgi:hypothetical protein